ncbi:MAG: type II toxin-antitoxin system VapC family toxin [Candidatus Saccharimonadales bacterium]
MTGYLLDTSVISALAPGKPMPDEGWVHWLRAQADSTYLPCIAIAELEQGICKLRRAGGQTRARRLNAWLDGLLADFADRILSLDAAVSRRVGQIADRAIAAGKHPGLADVAIAALAEHHKLMLLTQNLRHFQPLGVTCDNPLKSGRA